MKFHLQTPTSNLVTGTGPGWVRIGNDEHRQSLVLTGDTITPGFAPDGFDALTEADFERLLATSPDIVLLGTGATQRFLHPRITAPLHRAQVGLEVMDTRAACRTYNILVAEGAQRGGGADYRIATTYSPICNKVPRLRAECTAAANSATPSAI